MRQIKFQKTILVIMLLIVAAGVISCNSTQKLNLSDIKSTCDNLPDFREDPKGLKTITLEGYLIAAEKAMSGTAYDVAVGASPNSGETLKVNMNSGDGHNQIKFTDKNNFTIKTDNGEVLKPKDEVRITGTLGKTKTPEYSCQVSMVEKVEKP
ncbi:MAG: hypothetical protein ABIP78_02140 [Pyrinomonadaceae bacterium]